MKRIHLFFALLTALALMVGCGMEPSPVASGEATLTPGEDGRTFLTFTPQAADRVAKISAIPDEGRSVSALFDSDGGQLEVIEFNGSGSRDDLKIYFRVYAGALAEPVTINMTVYGNSLEELVVAFEPGGLEFLREAMLVAKIGADLVHTPLE